MPNSHSSHGTLSAPTLPPSHDPLIMELLSNQPNTTTQTVSTADSKTAAPPPSQHQSSTGPIRGAVEVKKVATDQQQQQQQQPTSNTALAIKNIPFHLTREDFMQWMVSG